MDTDTPMLMLDITVTITAKDLLSPPQLLNLDMVTVMLMDTDTPMLMLDITVTITVKDLLSPPLLLNLDTATMVMLTDTDTPMLDITVTITAKGLLKPSPIMVMLLMPTMVTVMVMATVMAMVILMASKFILLSFLSNYYNGCVYKKFYNLESFDLRSTVSEVQPLAYKKEALVMLSVILCRV